MEHWKEFIPPKEKIYNKKKEQFDDNIYTFDIETISLYYIDGKWQPFDYGRPSSFYEMTDKRSCCYIWQFGCNGASYYGRELMEFGEVLKSLKNEKVTKFIYVHNLSYEMQWLLDVIFKNNWHITELCARNIRQPIQFKIEELNIFFRCSYMLTNLSLDISAKEYGKTPKLKGDLDYNVPYSPLCTLPEKALKYCENDVVSLCDIIEHFRNLYNHVASIPLTQTGRVRHALRKEVGYYYIKKMQKLVPTAVIYDALMCAFMGGITHGNILYINKKIFNAWSFDECSEYPFCLCCEDYPSTPFRLIHNSTINQYKDTHCLLYHVRFKNLRSKYYNHFIPYSKITNIKEIQKTIDNGRISIFEGSFEMIITDVDFELIKQSYEIEKIEIIRVWASVKRPLDSKVVKFILENYSDKTTLKGVEGKEVIYANKKVNCNCIFGMSCTNPLKSGVYLEGDEWKAHDINDSKFLKEKLGDMKKSFSTLFFPMAIGCYCTAYARKNIWSCILKLDKDVAYYDTDSIKGTGDRVYKVIEAFNKGIEEKLQKYSKIHKLPIELFKPVDIKGICHPLGYMENETERGLMKEFKTLGAKKYYYIDADGNNHLTMSGITKKAVKCLSIDEFEKGFYFDYKDTGKLIHFYNNNQKPFSYVDVEGNTYRCSQQHSIILQPTTYKIGVTDELLKLALYYDNYVEDF